MIAVFDTNIIIDALNGVPFADIEFGRYQRVLISRISWMEVLVGAREDAEQVKDFLQTHFEIETLDEGIAETAVALRRERRLRLPDAIILATAICRDTFLVTRNTKDFRIEWPFIRVPYSL